MTDNGIDYKWIWWISPILLIIYAGLLIVSLTSVCYIVFRKRRIVYIDPISGVKKYKPNKYRWNSDVHVYHHDVLREYDGGMFMNKEMTQRYNREIKMPMHELLVYVKLPVNDDTDYSKEKNTTATL